MKLMDGFEIVEVGDSTVLVPTDSDDFKGVVNMNRSARFIAECLKEETTREEVLGKLKDHYGDVPEDTLNTALDKVLDLLRSIRALCE